MKKEETNEVFESNQTFKNKEGNLINLVDFIKEGDWWQTKGKRKATILTHECIKRIATEAGIKAKEYKILTQPDAMNNYQMTMCVVLVHPSGEQFIELGESNRSNLGSKGRSYPASMAQKRAFDRGVLSSLGITGLLSEEELKDDEEEDNMNNLTIDEQKKIAPMVNNLLLAKTKSDLERFNKKMKLEVEKYSPVELDYIRNLFKKKIAEISKIKF